MDRLIDKTLLTAACTLFAVTLDEPDAPKIVALLLAVIVSAAYELLEPHRPKAARATCALALLPLAVPGAAFGAPLFAYDLARQSLALSIATLVPIVLWGRAGALGLAPCATLVAVTLLSVALSRKTQRATSAERGLHALEDDLQDKVLALREKNRQLEDARVYETKAAALAERTRIARDIHDSVGHLLTRLTLQVEALRVIHADDGQVVDELGEIASGVNAALDSMRSSVHALADSATDLSVELNRLASGSGIANVEVRCDLPDDVPADVTRCVIAVSREALTNAARHARAGHATVSVASYPGLWQVSITNDGSVPSPGSNLERLLERGMGLSSMRERVQALGGTLRISSSDGMFNVFASIPRKQAS